MKRKPSELKIAELARISQVARSTIHHYRNLGLLPAPEVRGPKLHVFGPEHVARLREIARLRAQGLSLPAVKARLARRAPPRTRARSDTPRDPTRARILKYAAQMFVTQGYERTRLDDLATALHIAKATIYRHFASKQALFVGCVELIRFTLVSPAAREKSERESTLEDHGRERAQSVLENFSAFRGLTSLLGSLAHDPDPALAARAKSELHAMITSGEPYLRRLRDQGQLRPIDTELLAYMLWGALMGAGDRLVQDGRYSQAQVLEVYLDFVGQGGLVVSRPSTDGPAD